MAVTATILAFAALSLHVHAADVAVQGQAQDNFHDFMQRFGRTYEHGSPEYHERLALFQLRTEEANRHNSQTDRLWTAAVNHLTDRTEAELAQLRGWRGVASSGSGGNMMQKSGVGATFLNQRGRGRSLPQNVNWTSLHSAKRIVNQGGCGSCWAVTSAAVLTQHMEIHNPHHKRTFSAQELVSCVPNPHKCGGTGGCEGATVELAFHWTLHHGLTQEQETPYSGSNGHCKKHGLLQLHGSEDEISLEELTRPGVHSAPHGSPSLAFGMHAWERLPENAYEPLLRAVHERGPVAVSVAARDWSMYSSGIFNSCRKDAVIDHAVVLVGFGKDKSANKLYYLIQNSWGQDWGEDGHIRLLRRDHDSEVCGVDKQPEVGTGCEGGPKEVKVCGMCGVLYDSAVPHFRTVAA